MQDISTIKNYILFLKTKHHLSITLHPMRFTPVLSSSELLAFNIHTTSHCIYLKTCAGAQSHCVDKTIKKNLLLQVLFFWGGYLYSKQKFEHFDNFCITKNYLFILNNRKTVVVIKKIMPKNMPNTNFTNFTMQHLSC